MIKHHIHIHRKESIDLYTNLLFFVLFFENSYIPIGQMKRKSLDNQFLRLLSIIDKYLMRTLLFNIIDIYIYIYIASKIENIYYSFSKTESYFLYAN